MDADSGLQLCGNPAQTHTLRLPDEWRFQTADAGVFKKTDRSSGQKHSLECVKYDSDYRLLKIVEWQSADNVRETRLHPQFLHRPMMYRGLTSPRAQSRIIAKAPLKVLDKLVVNFAKSQAVPMAKLSHDGLRERAGSRPGLKYFDRLIAAFSQRLRERPSQPVRAGRDRARIMKIAESLFEKLKHGASFFVKYHTQAMGYLHFTHPGG